MKLVIKVNEEDYKRYKEDKVCSYASAVLDAVPLNEELEKIRAEINKLPDINPDYPMDRMVHICKAEALDIIDKYREGNK